MDSRTLLQRLLYEAPFIPDGRLDSWLDNQKGNLISDNALNRNYHFLFEMTKRTMNIRIYMHNSSFNVSGFIVYNNPSTHEKSNELIFTLDFYRVQTLKHKIPNAIQVKYVNTLSEYRDYGIASYVYLKLVELKRIIIISDSTQFEDGASLWKKMAKSSGISHKITIFDDIDNDFIRDSKNNIVEYNAYNIQDIEIWSRIDDISKQDTVLILQPK